MAEALAILGTAGALANIIDVLGKAVTTIVDLRSQWRDADLTIVTLETQLTALSTALGKIKTWADSEAAAEKKAHEQLIIDVDRCTICCHILVDKIDVELARILESTDTGVATRTGSAGKLRLLMNTKNFQHLQHMIHQQTQALTLMLTACNTSMLSEQTLMLNQSKTRQVLKKTEDDTASLYVLRDADSIQTSSAMSTISSALSSRQFTFDSELFVSRIYRRWMRNPSSLRKVLYEQQNDTPYGEHFWSERFFQHETMNEEQEAVIAALATNSQGQKSDPTREIERSESKGSTPVQPAELEHQHDIFCGSHAPCYGGPLSPKERTACLSSIGVAFWGRSDHLRYRI